MKEQPENWDKWSVERQIGYNLAIGKSDITEEKTIYKESTSAEIISSVLFYCLAILTVLVVVAIIGVFTVQLVSAIWGEYAVIYWLADLI